jgi:UDP-2,3-diacylglucosamine pyrophosphatase LpxH
MHGSLHTRATPASADAPAAHDDGFNYLLLSDVHLGSDIVPHLRPWAVSSWLREEPEVDARLVSLLAQYRRDADPVRPWRLVLAGDFLDLVGVSLATGEPLRTPPTAEEQRHGLGSASDHVVCKVRAIAQRHPRVFRELMLFVAAGHSLVIVRGNHDIELYWRGAQRALVDAIVAHARPKQRSQLRRRISVCPWFFAVEGVLYVEHGHEFDPMCSYGDPLRSTCVRDPRRIRWTPFSVLLRFVARPTRGLSSVAYGYVGMGAYIRLLLKLGLSGSVAIAARFTRASYRLLGECLLNAREKTMASAREAGRRFTRFARRYGVSEQRLERLRALYVPPGVHRFGFMARSLYLDRIVSGVAALLSLITASVMLVYASLWSWLPFAVSFALLLGYACIGSGSNRSPTATMRRGAADIAALFNVRWVVMGHTHEPVMEPVSATSSYVNLGSWGEDDPPDERSPVRHHQVGTYLVLRHINGDYRAEFLRWDVEQGALPMTAQRAAETTAPSASDEACNQHA